MKSFVVFFTVVLGVICNENERNEEKFIATHEWQPIKKGQKVPSGLHYRINLETGLTEAKLLDEEKENSVDRTDVLEVPSENEKDQTIEELKQVLKKIKNDDVKPGGKLKHNYRTYEQLKEELGSLNLTAKKDADILKDLFQGHKNELAKDKVDVDTILNILEDFDYLGHQFDNGLEFVRQNGFRDVIYKNFNSSHDNIKQNTLKLFGSLVQNNARVQIHALETGSVPVLLRFLSSDSSESIKNYAVYALGCLVRRFPLAQQKFLDNGGVSVVLQVFEKDSIKIQLKTVTLMTDLILEKRHAVENSNVIVLNQYKNIALENELLEQDWCLYINKLLVNIVNTNQDDHDSIEKCLISMEIVGHKCKHFNKSLLARLKDTYEHLAKSETTEDYFFKDIARLCSNILNNVREKSEL